MQSTPLEKEVGKVCAALRLFGYTSEEIDQILSDVAIHRPQSWKRY